MRIFKERGVCVQTSSPREACDLLRCFLPMATLTNVGVWGNGRSLEYLLVHLLADPFEENRQFGKAGQIELDQVIGPFYQAR